MSVVGAAIAVVLWMFGREAWSGIRRFQATILDEKRQALLELLEVRREQLLRAGRPYR